MPRALSLAATLAFSVVATAAPPVAHGQRLERDVAYGRAPRQTLDLVTPATKAFPTVVFVHGGSLYTGDKQDGDYGRVCEPFAAAGIACANVNYRLGDDAKWPAQPNDVAAAVAWVRSHIASYGGNPNALYLLGHSSGAMLVAVVASDTSFLAAHGTSPSAIRGVIPMGSIMWDDELAQAIAEHGRAAVAAGFGKDSGDRLFTDLDSYEQLWPIHHVHPGIAPFLFLIAETETIHPPVLMTDSVFADSTRKLGNQASWVVFKGKTHYRNVRELQEPRDTVFTTIRRFIQQHP